MAQLDALAGSFATVPRGRARGKRRELCAISLENSPFFQLSGCYATPTDNQSSAEVCSRMKQPECLGCGTSWKGAKGLDLCVCGLAESLATATRILTAVVPILSVVVAASTALATFDVRTLGMQGRFSRNSGNNFTNELNHMFYFLFGGRFYVFIAARRPCFRTAKRVRQEWVCPEGINSTADTSCSNNESPPRCRQGLGSVADNPAN